MAFRLAVYASQCRLPDPTQDSLLSVGYNSLRRASTRKDPNEGFQLLIHFITSLPPDLLDARWANSGESFAFENWFSREPNNKGNNEHYVALGNTQDIVVNGKRFYYRFGSR